MTSSQWPRSVAMRKVKQRVRGSRADIPLFLCVNHRVRKRKKEKKGRKKTKTQTIQSRWVWIKYKERSPRFASNRAGLVVKTDPWNRKTTRTRQRGKARRRVREGMGGGSVGVRGSSFTVNYGMNKKRRYIMHGDAGRNASDPRCKAPTDCSPIFTFGLTGFTFRHFRCPSGWENLPQRLETHVPLRFC